MKKYHLYILFILLTFPLGINKTFAQEEENKTIEIIHGGTLTIDNKKYPDATIFNSDKTGQVQFRHQGVDIWCDLAILNEKKNQLQAYGNVFLQQGDTLKMNSGYLAYNGDSRVVTAKENVDLRNDKMNLKTEVLFFNREEQIAYYNDYATITDEENILNSREGRYLVTPAKSVFTNKVKITNPDFTIDSDRLDYYHNSGHTYFYGPTNIVGKEYKVYCEKGFYNTKMEFGNFHNKAKIDYDKKILEGDSLYFDSKKSFASATNNIRITDTINKVIIRGHYGEVYKEKDSMFITKKALLVNYSEKDSTYLHAKKIMATGTEKERIIRAFPYARIFKTDMQGKCDSIYSSEQSGITKLIGNPVLWNGENQVTGDSIQLIANIKTEKLDSLKVINNAFIIEKDTIGTGYNQVKGKLMLGKITDNKLKYLNLYQNTETIYYAYTEKKDLVGINKLICSRIKLEMDDSQKIETISFYVNPSGDLYPEDKLPEEERKLIGFIWRGNERIRRKEEIFSEEEKNLKPSKIQETKTREEVDKIEEALNKTLNQEEKEL